MLRCLLWVIAAAIRPCDFFCVRTITFRMLYVFVVINHASRQVVHVHVTPHPTASWTAQQIAKEIILTGADRIAAPEAARMGLINRVVPRDQVESAALALARHIAVIDPSLVQQTKRAINQCFEAMGLIEALNAALDIDLAIEGNGSDDKRKFMEIARKDGLRKAIAWRDARFTGSGDE